MLKKTHKGTMLLGWSQLGGYYFGKLNKQNGRGRQKGVAAARAPSKSIECDLRFGSTIVHVDYARTKGLCGIPGRASVARESFMPTKSLASSIGVINHNEICVISKTS